MADILDIADRLWRGEVNTTTFHPLGPPGSLVEITDNVAFVPTFANVSAVSTPDGLVMVDTGASFVAQQIFDQLRGWKPSHCHTAVFSHGHIDHVFGVGVWEEHAAGSGLAGPEVIAHHHLPRRFDRYILTAGYNEVINRRQFSLEQFRWPTEFRYPDRTYHDHLHLEVGGTRFELHHEKGETDDATVTWFPEARVLCTGDLFIWASPNAGNPQKVQRYPREWAAALRRMLELDAEFLLPGHGFPVVGADRVRIALSDTAEFLESLVDQTLALMNAGARLDEVLHSVKVPAALADKPYLRPVYDEPEFIVRNIWRLYGGWWDGNPSSLKPAPEADLAVELADLAGGAAKVADRAVELLGSAQAAVDPEDAEQLFRLAGHLAEMAWLAAPSDAGIGAARRQVYSALAARATSTMAKGVFGWAARESSPHRHP